MASVLSFNDGGGQVCHLCEVCVVSVSQMFRKLSAILGWVVSLCLDKFEGLLCRGGEVWMILGALEA